MLHQPHWGKKDTILKGYLLHGILAMKLLFLKRRKERERERENMQREREGLWKKKMKEIGGKTPIKGPLWDKVLL